MYSVEHKDKITGITFWNVSDRYTWLDGERQKKLSFIIDMNRQPKKAYWDVVNFDAKNETWNKKQL